MLTTIETHQDYVLNVLVHGKKIHHIPYEGRTYVEGRKGSEFTLQFINNTFRSVMVKLTVDGLSVMDGKPATLTPDRGYIVRPYGSIEVPGWRLNDDQVAKFVFKGKGGSYAATKGDATNAGVIGCAVFPERPERIAFNYTLCSNLGELDPPQRLAPDISWSLHDNSDSAPEVRYRSATLDSPRSARSVTRSTASAKGMSLNCSMAPEPSFNLGTGFGAAAANKVETVDFRPELTPAQVLEIHYNDRKGLESLGIVVRKLKKEPLIPVAFPAAGCTPPKGWRG